MTGMHLALLATATSRGTAVPASQRDFPGSPPVQPLPVVASPRACFTSAPRCGIVVSSRSNGATEKVSRQSGAPRRTPETRVSQACANTRKDAWQDRASGSPGVSPRRLRCRSGTDATDDRTQTKWGDVLVIEDGVRDGMRSSGEVAPCPSTTKGADRMHDILRDSGAADHADPGAFLETWDRVKVIPARIDWGNSDDRCWLFGDGFLGRRHAHPIDPCRHRDQQVI